MKKSAVMTTVLALGLLAGSAQATTVFSATEDADFLNANNWSSGVPDGSNGAGRMNAAGVLSGSTNYNAGGSNIIVGHGSSASFTIDSGSTLTMTGGKLDVGRGSNVGTFTVNGGLDTSGNITVINGSMVVDDKLSIKGVATINNDGLLSVANNIDLVANTSSQLYFDSGASFAGAPGIVTVRNDSTLGFAIDGAGNHTTLAGDSLQLRLAGASSALVVDFLAAPALGETFDLITGVEKFANYNGAGTGYEFASVTVNGLDAGQDYSLIYDTTVADAGFLRLEVIPEPATLGMVALFGGGMLFIRRKLMI